MADIASIKIYPPIGFARLGNHPSATYDGPQQPFDTASPPRGYKKDGQVKRQAAVFRLFGYDAQGKLVGEVTSKMADIRWHVDVANKKAAWREFDGPKLGSLRNAHAPVDARHRLEIRPTARSVTSSKRKALFDDGSFTDWKAGTAKTATGILLGELHMAKAGFLRVLAGPGTSRSPYNRHVGDYANNPGWCDDAADGPVSASVTLHGKNLTFEAEGAWVVMAPPKFGGPIRNIISLYDMLKDRAVGEGRLTLPGKPSFAYDVYPLIEAALQIKWLLKIGGHAFEYLLKPDSSLQSRKSLVSMVANPSGTGAGAMPRLLNDEGRPGLKLTKLQYATLVRWSKGEVLTTGEHAGPPSPQPAITPEGMERAALEACVGGAFFPGIEVSWLLRDEYEFMPDDPFRLSVMQSNPRRTRLTAGDLTKQLAVPWQADFQLCRKEEHINNDYGWWPAARPDDVLFGSDTTPKRWAGTVDNTHKSMVEGWHTLGFVEKDGARFVVKQT